MSTEPEILDTSNIENLINEEEQSHTEVGEHEYTIDELKKN